MGIKSELRITVTCIEEDDGAASVIGLTYAAESQQGGARIVGNGTLQHPLKVKLTPEQAAANSLLEALKRTRDALRSHAQNEEAVDTGYTEAGHCMNAEADGIDVLLAELKLAP